jgi:hypothetical protein
MSTAMASDLAGGGVILFGGFGSALLGDTWRCQGGAWRQMTAVAGPPARMAH